MEIKEKIKNKLNKIENKESCELTTETKKISKKQQQIIALANETVLPENYNIVWTEEQLNNLCDLLEKEDFVALDTETKGTNPFKDEIVGFSLWLPKVNQGFYVPIKHVMDVGELVVIAGIVGRDYVKCLKIDLIKQKIKPLLESSKKFIFHNSKFDMHVFYNWMGIKVVPYFDTLIASALLDENVDKGLKDLSALYLKQPADKFSSLFGKETFDTVPILLDDCRKGCLAGYYAIKDTYMTYMLYDFFNRALQREDLKAIKDIMFNIEMPLIPVVWEAEQRGVKFDVDYMQNEVAPKLLDDLGVCPKCYGFYSINNSISEKNRNGKYKSKFYFCECGGEKKEGIAQQIWKITGEFNLKSNVQLSDILFNKLKFPSLNPDKPFSADKKHLKKIRKELKNQGREQDVKLIDLLSVFRADTKLIDAFVIKLPKEVINGRVHTSFNTVGTVTMRFSSSDPNLQQIPSKVGGLIRRAFIADSGRLLLSCDFSGQELRILAHMSQCPVLTELFKTDQDPHAKTAVGIYNKMYNANIDYEYFQYCRSLQEYFLDKDLNIDENKFNSENINKLYREGLIKTKDISVLKDDVKNGKIFEKIRKDYAKALNFGIVYGITEIGISDNLDVTKEEALVMIESFMKTYPGVKRWIDEQKKFINKNKYTLSMCGGKRRLYNLIDSTKPWLLESAYRQGINAIIQRSAAEQTKIATLKLQPLLKEIGAHILLWVHDEIIFDVPKDIGIENIKRITECMCNAVQLNVPMKSDFELGERWSEKFSESDIQQIFNESMGGCE